MWICAYGNRLVSCARNRCNFHRRILLMMAYAHTIVFKFLCRSGKADERCARLELGCRCSAVRPTLVLGQHGGCVLFRDYAFGDLAQVYSLMCFLRS
ncbi:uncharacterized protein LOC120666402 isoform X2 [Panicum virgatum]|uniref:uncharacterized protein LOC120666402 isoform X2 n=1 Tax=Panicum virgatum TaxID=38727 RepID=UPI0019D50FD2|nr:uncharacterized protein LOC120666402 isoform X2 [Panicum virgatum]